MSAAPAAKLYTPEILGLAVKLAEYPLTSEHSKTGEARSKTCGSEVGIGLVANDAGQIQSLGLKVTACAIGQASAALFAQSATGKTLEDIEAALRAIEDWLAGGDEPEWPGIDVLVPALVHPARHGAITLAWQAALNALCSKAKPR